MADVVKEDKVLKSETQLIFSLVTFFGFTLVLEIKLLSDTYQLIKQ
jgi:hypothetical protein